MPVTRTTGMRRSEDFFMEGSEDQALGVEGERWGARGARSRKMNSLGGESRGGEVLCLEVSS